MESNDGVQRFECCVIGAGVVGCATAYHLAKQGREVLLLEQFPLPHSRGSSHGQTRIIRFAYAEDKFSQLMPESFKLWKEIEAKSCSVLVKQSGLLICSDKVNPFLKENFDTLQIRNKQPQMLNSAEIKNRFPMLSFDDEVEGVLEPSAGILLANKCLQSLQDLTRANGGIIKDQEPVTNINQNSTDGRVIITTTKGMYSVENVAMTTGAYSCDLLKTIGVDIPLKTLGIQVCYWPITDPAYKLENGFPAFIFELSNGLHVYGIPSFEYPGLLKVCQHTGVTTHPCQRSADLGCSDETLSTLSAFIHQHLKGVEPKATIVEECLYCQSPDSSFIIDYHPRNKNIVIGTGFSGHGFKTAPTVGKIISQMMTNQSVTYDIREFSLDRFKTLHSSL